uniref:THAP-type domain-containing protein n=1 Tax=Eptatretus burgeri TaxID=7764 RepID=A0A8C4WUX8_EPTBU
KMPQCVAFACNNKSGKSSTFTFHRFPKDEKLCRQWGQAQRREHFTPTPGVTLLCREHFLNSDFDSTGQTKWLKQGLIRNFNPILIMLFYTQKPIHRKPPVDRHLAPEAKFTAAPDSPPRPSTSADHTYCADPSPSKMKRKLGTATETIENLRTKLKVTQQKTRRLKKKVEKLISVVEELKNKGMVSENCVEILNSTFSGVLLELPRHTEDDERQFSEGHLEIYRKFV